MSDRATVAESCKTKQNVRRMDEPCKRAKLFPAGAVQHVPEIIKRIQYARTACGECTCVCVCMWIARFGINIERHSIPHFLPSGSHNRKCRKSNVNNIHTTNHPVDTCILCSEAERIVNTWHYNNKKTDPKVTEPVLRTGIAFKREGHECLCGGFCSLWQSVLHQKGTPEQASNTEAQNKGKHRFE